MVPVIAMEIKRHEIKFYINQMDASMIESRLRLMMARDPFAGTDGTYKIRSLYFDDMKDTALWDNLGGVDSRAKYRLRFYNKDSSFVKLECKAKSNGLTGKRTALIGKAEAMRILRGDIGFLAEASHPVLMDFYLACNTRLLRPKVIVDYIRTAFIALEGDTRITIDSGIRTAPINVDLFDLEAATVPALDARLSILEVKYDCFLPGHLAWAVALQSRMKQAASKFVMGRMLSFNPDIQF